MSTAAAPITSSQPELTLDDTASNGPKGPRKRQRRQLLSAVAIGAGLAVLKLKTVLLLFVAKFKLLLVNPFEGFGVAQFALTGGSMIVTIFAYATKTKLSFAIGFVVITAVHELGHALIIRANGLRAGALVFIPFVGGAVTLKNQPRSAYTDAQIGLAGPVAGTLAAICSYLIYHFTVDPLFLALAAAGFLLNLFNLMPIAPLDGGRIAAAITKWMWLLGVIILSAVMVLSKSPFLILILLLGVFQIYRAIKRPHRMFYNVSWAQRASIATVYFTLVVFLGYATVVAHRQLIALT